MSFDLPPHLQTLNSIPTSSPVAGIDAEQEDAFWGYMHTDDLFRNFGFVPSPNELNKKPLDDDELNTKPVVPTPTAAAEQPQTVESTSSATPSSSSGAATLESFLAAFANEPNPYLMSLPYTTPSTSAPTPINGVNTHDVMGGPSVEDDDDEDKPSGAKKLKQMGAGQNEIEEDKRRRNTEASARFRAKKKEREQAVEKRAKELEAQVAKLAAEKASLENENRLLKAIVLNGSGGQAEALQGALNAFGAKRKRQE